MTGVLVGLISLYQRYLSLDQGWLGRVVGTQGRICRYEPSCSEYARQAVERFGVAGLWLGLKRIGRCQPWGGYGWDPIPERVS